MALRARWTEDETKRALYLYFQTPFGRMHSSNPEIIALAKATGRTPSSIAMKLANFASLDPAITRTGRKGLEGASALDRKIWAEFHADWTRLIVDASGADEEPPVGHSVRETPPSFNYEPPSGVTTTRVEIEQRVGQTFFRRAVMANYENSCCVTGIADLRLLNASHITPWQTDVENRHNPRNGLCLSATFDRAFDRGLMTVTADLRVRLSGQLLKSENAETRSFFAPYEGRMVRQATHLAPDPALLLQHNDRFLD
jgi:putative restriction endonuclease